MNVGLSISASPIVDEAIDSARTGICILSLDLRITWVSHRDHPLFDDNEARGAIGTPFENHWIETDRHLVAKALDAALRLGHGRCYVRPAATSRNSSRVDISLELRHDAEGKPAELLVSLHTLPNSERAYRGLFDTSDDRAGRDRLETTQRRLLECSRATGQQFFVALVRAISDSLGARHVYVAEVHPERPGVLRTLAAYVDGRYGDFGQFTPHANPCAKILETGLSYFIPSGVQNLYPDTEELKRFDITSYVGTPLFGSDGRIIGIIGARDDRPMDAALKPIETVEVFAGRAAAEIQRLRTEASLRQSEEEYRIITDAVPALILFLDTDVRFRFVNAAISSWFGVDPKDAKGKHLAEVIGPQAYTKIEGMIKRALSGERVAFERVMPYAHGNPRHVRADYVPYIDGGRVRGFFALVSDISFLRASEEALSKSEHQFRTLFEHLPVGAALVDFDGRVLLENDVFAKVLPLTKDATSARVFDRACTSHNDDGTPLPEAAHPVRQALQGKVARDVEFLCRYADGRQMWARMSGIPIHGNDGRVTGALVVVADIHSEKRAEARRTLLINELNHRVKNTLASVQSIASQTFRTSTLTKDGLDAFEERLLALSNAHNLLTQEGWEGADLKRIVSLVLEPHDPGGNRLRTQGPSVRLKPPAALAFAMALHELATNAVKYGALSFPGGTVRLDWQLTKGDDKRLQLQWIERGGPTVQVPERKGFGTRLIERSLAFELGSTSSIRYEPEGVVCEIDAELREITG